MSTTSSSSRPQQQRFTPLPLISQSSPTQTVTSNITAATPTSPTTTNTIASSSNTNSLSQTLSTPASQQTSTSASSLPASHDVTSARTAVVASLSNLLDRNLQSRAGMLHENARALGKQEEGLRGAVEGLRKEREALGREVEMAGKGLKEVGSVQNWAEVLEGGFLVLEETMRLVREGSEGSWSGSGSCSCSDCGRSEVGDGDDKQGDYRLVGKEVDVVEGEGLGMDWMESLAGTKDERVRDEDTLRVEEATNTHGITVQPQAHTL